MKTQFYPVQANARGGIGQVLAIGAKAGKNLLTAVDVEGGTSCKTTVMGVSGKFSSFEADDSYFQYAAREWEGRGQVIAAKPLSCWIPIHGIAIPLPCSSVRRCIPGYSPAFETQLHKETPPPHLLLSHMSCYVYLIFDS